MNLNSAITKAKRILKEKAKLANESSNTFIITRDESEFKEGSLTLILYTNSI